MKLPKPLSPRKLQQLESKTVLNSREYVTLRNHYYALLYSEGFNDIEWNEASAKHKHNNYIKESKGGHSLQKPLSAYQIDILQNFLNKYERYGTQILISLRNHIMRLNCMELRKKFDLKRGIQVDQFDKILCLFKQLNLSEHRKTMELKKTKMTMTVREKKPLTKQESQSDMDNIDNNTDKDNSTEENISIRRELQFLTALHAYPFQYECYQIFKRLSTYFFALLRVEGLTYDDMCNYMNMIIHGENTEHINISQSGSGVVFKTVQSVRASFKGAYEQSHALQLFSTYKPVFELLMFITGKKVFKKITSHLWVNKLLSSIDDYEKEESTADKDILENCTQSFIMSNDAIHGL